MSTERREILVYAHWVDFKTPIFMGVLYTSLTKGKELFSFEYDADWLKLPKARAIDPDLQLYSGPQYLNNDKSNFGIFLDSSPNRWGRLLMKRKEVAIARKEERIARNLFESDYVLGVFEENRMGALRFKTDPNGDFLDNNAQMAAPPWYSVYDKIGADLNITLAGCLVNARRKFHDALDSDKKRAQISLELFRKIYTQERVVEEEVQNDFERRKELRDQKIKPLLVQIKTWIEAEQLKVLPKSLMGKVKTYFVNQYPKLEAIFDDGVWNWTIA